MKLITKGAVKMSEYNEGKLCWGLKLYIIFCGLCVLFVAYVGFCL